MKAVECTIMEELDDETLTPKVSVCIIWGKDGKEWEFSDEPGYACTLALTEVVDMVKSLEGGAEGVELVADDEYGEDSLPTLYLGREDFLAVLEEGDVFRRIEAVGMGPTVAVTKEKLPSGQILATIHIPKSD